MRLVVIRHAEAVERGLLRRDCARPLTPGGRRRFARQVRGLRRLGERFDLVLHSPWLRAVQTADLLAPLVRGRFAVTPHLARRPGDALLTEMTGACTAVVGHEPWLSELVARLLTGETDDAGRYMMKKGGVVVLEGVPQPGAMRLVAAYPPKTLRRVGK